MTSSGLSPVVRDVAPFLDRRLDGWIADLQAMVRTPSPFEAEEGMTALVEARLRAVGCPEVWRVTHDPGLLRGHPDAVPPISERPGRHSVVARVRGTGGGPTLAFNCHLDTAAEGPPETWSRPPFSGDVDPATRRLYGRGAMDDKAGAALCLALVDTLVNGPVRLRGDVVLQFVLEDEITGNGTLLCLEAGPRPDAALILDGTRPDRAIREHAGQLQVHLRVKGRPASVAVSHLGRSAAEMLAELALALKRDVHGLNDGRVAPWDRFPSPFQCVLQELRSEAPIFTLPEDASARLYLTFCPPMSLAAVKARLVRVAGEFARDHGWPEPPVVTWGDYQLDPVASESEALEALLQAAVGATGLAAIDVGPSTGTSDMRHFARRGIPCLLYGPGTGFNPHRPDEYYQLDDLRPMLTLYLEAAVRFCGPAHAAGAPRGSSREPSGVKVAPADLLDELGIARGDLVFVKASMDRLGYGPRETVTLLGALVERVGGEGTLVMPTFPYPNEVGRSAPGFVFDVRRTPSAMGLLSEALRRYPGARRSEQYWVPASAWGRLAAALTEGQLSLVNPFGPGSTYRRLADHGVKMVGLGVSLNYNIMTHVADAVLAPRCPFPVFAEEPIAGTVVSEDGRRHETRTLIVGQASRLRTKPARLHDESARLRAATRFFDHNGGFAWSLPGGVWLEEALAVGGERLDRGRLPPWLEEMTG